jgi:DNA-binding response OmpR family regulator
MNGRETELNAYSIAATTPLSTGLPAGSRDTQAPQKRKARILVVDDDPGLLRLLTIRLRAENYDVEAVESASAALAACVRFRPDLVITDLRMDNMDGIGLLKELQSRWPGLKVIILTAHGTIPDAVYATQSGAFGFLTKPVDKQELLDHVQKALKVSGFAHVDEDWRANIITRNQLMEDKLAQANMVAGTDARVLLTGESGTGKELLARAIHEASPRRNKPFVTINCSAMAENLLESELFGHERGAVPGATRAQKGLFETADGGTLLLDEVGDMPMRLQVKLLRVLQENAIRPVGGADVVQTRGPLLPSECGAHRSAVLGPTPRGHSLVGGAFSRTNRQGKRPAQDLRAGSGGASGHGRVAGQRAPALQRGAPERRVIERPHHHRGIGAAITRRQSHPAALLRRGAR